MGGDRKKGFSVALFLMVMLLTANICKAASAKSKGTDAHRCRDRLEECLIGDMESEEYSMDSEISRRFLQVNSGQTVTGGTGNPNGPAVPCGQPEYGPCLGEQNGPPKDLDKCGQYNRACYQAKS